MDVGRLILRFQLKGNLTEHIYEIEVGICPEELCLTDEACLEGSVNIHSVNVLNHIVGAVCAVFGRVDTQIACIGDLGANTARIFRKRAVLGAVWAVKSAFCAF